MRISSDFGYIIGICFVETMVMYDDVSQFLSFSSSPGAFLLALSEKRLDRLRSHASLHRGMPTRDHVTLLGALASLAKRHGAS